MNKICPKCGTIAEDEDAFQKCECGEDMVHICSCSGCRKTMLYLIDDDYCGLDYLFCPECSKKIMEKKHE